MPIDTCPVWPASYAECGPCPPLDGLTVEESARWERMAVEYLWNWTGRTFGLCPVTIRPCRDLNWVGHGRSGGGFQPVLVEGRWYNLGCGMCLGTCSCDRTPSIRLPGPIDSVTSVTIDGDVLAPSAYRVDNAQLLVRVDGNSWPTVQHMDVPTTAPGTWEVQYVRGTPAPLQGQLAAGLLACELAKAACNDSTCKLPQRIQTITRQGVTMAMLDPMNDIDKGHTGIWLVDSFVASVMRPQGVPRVYSPDVPRNRDRVQTWPLT